MVKNTKKYISIFMSAIMSLGSNMFVCKTYAAEANIDMANVKMLIVDLANSHTPSLSNNENCSFSDENTVCDLTGRMGSSYYIVFGINLLEIKTTLIKGPTTLKVIIKLQQK